MFNLPAYDQLSEEQDTVCFLPLEGTHLVVGPPGTGKTVLAVYRAQLCTLEPQQTGLLVYNNTLAQYLRPAAASLEVNPAVCTYFSWFCTWYLDVTGSVAPQLKPYVLDWPTILCTLARLNPRTSDGQFDQLIVDEAQDLPPAVWPVLRLTSRNLTVFADENQSLSSQNSTVEQIRAALGVDTLSPLRKNYRNTLQIARFAATFYTGLPSGIPDLPERQGPRPRVIYTGTDMAAEVELVARYALNHPRSEVGVLLPHKRQMYGFWDLLCARLNGALPAIRVQMFVSGDPLYRQVDFTAPGVKILNYQSAKGLEFDAVFMPRIDRWWQMDPRSKAVRMTYYTMTSRARHELIITHYGPNLPEALEHVPTDLYERSSAA